MSKQLLLISFCILNFMACREAEDPIDFDQQMAAYINDERNLNKLNDALEVLRKKKVEEQRLEKEKIDAEKLQKQLSNPVQIDIGDSPVKGSADAKVIIVEFSDFQCPFCAVGSQRMDEIEKKYQDKVKFVYKFFPLPGHDMAMPAAKATLAAGMQNKFWQMYDLIFKNQRNLKDKEVFEKFAQTLKLNMDKFKKDIQNPEYEKRIMADVELGNKLGIDGTPAYYVNGISIVGAQPFEKFKAMIDQSLAK